MGTKYSLDNIIPEHIVRGKVGGGLPGACPTGTDVRAGLALEAATVPHCPPGKGGEAWQGRAFTPSELLLRAGVG